ncbi:MAG TPA: D-Ala-D-Ala carboxypeptidase family metallohydrolase [Candidatus Gastranaerophilales bacterium]|nr:D-Ala-D-Ala carboxypeptidase family metallohydrolase [Candidatus Gastranaerophilales bacterium]
MLEAKLQNFIEKELSCRCCGKLIINHEALIYLQAFRYYLNRKYGKNIRIIPTCGTRCYQHNIDVGGEKGSYHLSGQAFDIISPDITYRQIYDAAIESRLFSTVIRYDKSLFVHVDTRKRARYKIESWVENK